MPKREISEIDDRILQVMAEELGTTPEAILERILADIRINRAGIRPDDTPEEVEARLVKLEAKAAKARADREPKQGDGE